MFDASNNTRYPNYNTCMFLINLVLTRIRLDNINISFTKK